MDEHLSNPAGRRAASQRGARRLDALQQDGRGPGPKRFTGVGPGAWGRVLVSADVINRRVTDEATGQTTSTLEVSFTGDEIADKTVTLTRRIWANDPGDLSSPMHYAVEVVDRPAEIRTSTGLRPSAIRVLGVVKDARRSLDMQLIGDRLAEQPDFPLKARTIQAALGELEAAGLITRGEHVGFGRHEWCAVD